MKGLEKTFKALANRRRLLILKHLRDKREASVGELSGVIRLSLRSTSKHLGVLSATELLEKEQRGLQVFYRLSDDLSRNTRQIISWL